MQPATFDVRAAFAGLPLVTRGQLNAAAYRLGQYITCVTNSEDGYRFGAAIADRFPVLEQAVAVLGHAVARQACPEAPPAASDDHSPDAQFAADTYASIGTWLMASIPHIDHRLGPYAAGCTVAVLYGHGASPSPLARTITTRSLCLLDQVIQVCAAGDAVVEMRDGRDTSVSASAPALDVRQERDARGVDEHDAH